jgi:uncharacterized protein YjcR
MMKIISNTEMKKIVAEIYNEPHDDKVAHLTDLHKAAPIRKRKRIKLIPLAHGFNGNAL